MEFDNKNEDEPYFVKVWFKKIKKFQKSTFFYYLNIYKSIKINEENYDFCQIFNSFLL